MRQSEYKRKKGELEIERDRLKDALGKVEAKISALDLVWNEVFCDEAKSGETESHGGNGNCVDNTTERTVVINGQASELIDGATILMTGDFGVREIEENIHQKYPTIKVNRTTIAGRLSKLVDGGLLVLVEKGRGRRPGSFRRAS